MIRLEVTVKDRYGYGKPTDLERKLKRVILAAVSDTLEENFAEPVRIQFLPPPAAKKRKPKA